MAEGPGEGSGATAGSLGWALVVGSGGNGQQHRSWSLGQAPEGHTCVRAEDGNRGSFPAVFRETEDGFQTVPFKERFCCRAWENLGRCHACHTEKLMCPREPTHAAAGTQGPPTAPCPCSSRGCQTAGRSLRHAEPRPSRSPDRGSGHGPRPQLGLMGLDVGAALRDLGGCVLEPAAKKGAPAAGQARVLSREWAPATFRGSDVG